VYELSGQTAPRRLTFEGLNRYPIWSADGARVAYQSDREGDLGIFWQPVDGGSAERLTKPEEKDVGHFPDSWTPDGQSLSYTARKGIVSGVIWILSLKDKEATAFSIGSNNVGRSEFSPDGRWLAYQSLDSTTGGVLVEPFPPTGSRHQVARREAVTPHHPFWSRDGKELFYIPGPNMFAVVRVTTQPSFATSNPVSIPTAGFLEGGPQAPRSVDILPDGQTFIAIINAEQAQSGAPFPGARINVVLNWFEEVKQRMSTR
jgi:Tol biopolymer transport system component